MPDTIYAPVDAPKRSMGRELLELLVMVVLVVAAVLLVRSFVVTPYEVPTASMEPTIMVQDRVFSVRVGYYFHDPAPGDIVTFDDPEVPGRTLVKRVIATGGQTVELSDGAVYVDGVALQEDYVHGLPSEQLVPQYGVDVSYPYTVPEGHVWVMGDNRTNSSDSRVFGAVSVDSVTGHVLLRYWPLDRFGGLG